jgi:pimeloyl-ACP methyl ester carboxylesterase
MDTLGNRRFAMVGHDTGMWIGYALAADAGRFARLTSALVCGTAAQMIQF